MDFKGRMEAALRYLGARPSEGYHFCLDTLGGPLMVSAYDNWVATRFLDVEQARRFVAVGSLNTYSGKWNWHFPSEPGEPEVRQTFAAIAGVLPMPEHCAVLTGQITDCSRPVSVALQWLDHDEVREVVFQPEFPRGVNELAVFSLACCVHDGVAHFAPEMVGLGGPRPSSGQAMQKVIGLGWTQAKAPTDSRSFGVFVDQCIEAALGDGWPEGLGQTEREIHHCRER